LTTIVSVISNIISFDLHSFYDKCIVY